MTRAHQRLNHLEPTKESVERLGDVSGQMLTPGQMMAIGRQYRLEISVRVPQSGDLRTQPCQISHKGFPSDGCGCSADMARGKAPRQLL
jgi:hypothetical protein